MSELFNGWRKTAETLALGAFFLSGVLVLWWLDSMLDLPMWQQLLLLVGFYSIVLIPLGFARQRSDRRQSGHR
jgi:hypothetical protein